MPTLPATDDATAVVLKAGLSVPLAALHVLWNLEERGFNLTVEGDALLVRPRDRLTVDDDRKIRRHREALAALVRHCELES